MRGSARLPIPFSALISNLYASFLCMTAEEAQKHVRGLEENAVHVKYIELVRPHRRSSGALRLCAEYLQFAEFKRMEREHQKEKQKLLKDKDAGASAVHSRHSYSHAVFQCSEKPTYEG